jgi:hypothetical protein
VDDPETPAKTIEAPTVIIPRLPRINPKQALEKSTIFLEIPPLSINTPASINNGIAIRGQESRAANILWGINTNGMLGSARRAIDEPIPKEKAIGIPMMKRIAIERKRMKSVIFSFFPRFKTLNIR